MKVLLAAAILVALIIALTGERGPVARGAMRAVTLNVLIIGALSVLAILILTFVGGEGVTLQESQAMFDTVIGGLFLVALIMRKRPK